MIQRAGLFLLASAIVLVGDFMPIAKSQKGEILLSGFNDFYVTFDYMIPIFIILVTLFCIYRKNIHMIIRIMIFIVALFGSCIHYTIAQAGIDRLNVDVDAHNALKKSIVKRYERISSTYHNPSMPQENRDAEKKDYLEAKELYASPWYAEGTYLICAGYSLVLTSCLSSLSQRRVT